MWTNSKNNGEIYINIYKCMFNSQSFGNVVSRYWYMNFSCIIQFIYKNSEFPFTDYDNVHKYIFKTYIFKMNNIKRTVKIQDLIKFMFIQIGLNEMSYIL